MAIEVTAFAFDSKPDVTVKATYEDGFLQLTARRDEGELLGQGGAALRLLAEDAPALPPNTAQFRFRTLPGFTFTATLMVEEVWTAENAKRGAGWVDLKVRNDATGEENPIFSLSMAGFAK